MSGETKKRLTAKQIKEDKFVLEFLKDLNGTQAVIRAGYAPKSARVTAAKLLALPNIQKKIAKAQEEAAKRAKITVDEVLVELKTIGFSKITDFAEWGDGKVSMKPSSEIPAHAVGAISEVTQVTHKDGSSQLKFKLHNKTHALELTAKHLGMLFDRLQHSGPKGGPIQHHYSYKVEFESPDEG